MRKLVVDFVTFLKNCNLKALPAKKKIKVKLADEPFIGMWQDREDMRDSTRWCVTCSNVNGGLKDERDRVVANYATTAAMGLNYDRK